MHCPDSLTFIAMVMTNVKSFQLIHTPFNSFLLHWIISIPTIQYFQVYLDSIHSYYISVSVSLLAVNCGALNQMYCIVYSIFKYTWIVSIPNNS